MKKLFVGFTFATVTALSVLAAEKKAESTVKAKTECSAKKECCKGKSACSQSVSRQSLLSPKAKETAKQ
jgi:hypothetical protein